MRKIFWDILSAIRKLGKSQPQLASLTSSDRSPSRPDQTQRYALALLPMWVLAGVLDYVWHRARASKRRAEQKRALPTPL